MMSSCCTLRLNRRSAFSSGSPSCKRTSAKECHLQTCLKGHLNDTGSPCHRRTYLETVPSGLKSSPKMSRIDQKPGVDVQNPPGALTRTATAPSLTLDD